MQTLIYTLAFRPRKPTPAHCLNILIAILEPTPSLRKPSGKRLQTLSAPRSVKPI